MLELPKILVPPGAIIEVDFARNFTDAATDRVILLRGAREGFFALGNILLYFIASLGDSLSLFDIPFVFASSNIVSFTVVLDNEVVNEVGILTSSDGVHFLWRIAEEKLALIAGLSIQPLGYVTADHQLDHVHIDAGLSKEDISIYCEVITTKPGTVK